MARSGVGRAAAPVTGLLGLILLLGPDRPHELPEHYRVELEVPPVDAALWFAARYPQYFMSGETGLRSWLDGLDPRDRLFVLAMAQTLTWAWVEHELDAFEQRELTGLVDEAITAVRLETLNQLDLNADQFPEMADIEIAAHYGDPQFADGVFARLVRGISNCEGQNHLVALLLDSALEPSAAWLPGIDASMVGVPKHDLVRLSGPMLAQPIYVDAWSNLPAFTVDPSQPGAAPSLAELGDPPPPVVADVAGRAPLAVEFYANSQGTTIVLLPERHAPTKRVSLRVRAPALDRASLARIDDPWRVYLYARILHIYDDPRATDMYQFVLDHHCDSSPPPRTFICIATALLLKRIER
ncbi:MAG TPA: hypothetical protein VK034_30700 [Enhygromyxa sp.]|nr:hypothetical protein [Enhygromyxa sp.]